MSIKQKTSFYNSIALTADDSSDKVEFQLGITNLVGYLKVVGADSTTTTDVDIQTSPDGTNWYDVKSFTQITGATGSEIIQFNNTTEHVMRFVRANVDLGVVLQATVTIELHYDIVK